MDGKRYFSVLVVAALLGACLGGAVFRVTAAVDNHKTKAGTKPLPITQTTITTTNTEITLAVVTTASTGLPIPTRTGFPTGSRPTGIPGGGQFPTDRPVLTPAQPVPSATAPSVP